MPKTASSYAKKTTEENRGYEAATLEVDRFIRTPGWKEKFDAHANRVSCFVPGVTRKEMNGNLLQELRDGRLYHGGV